MPNCESCGNEISPDGEHFTHYEPQNGYSAEVHALCSPGCMRDYLDALDDEDDADEEEEDA